MSWWKKKEKKKKEKEKKKGCEARAVMFLDMRRPAAAAAWGGATRSGSEVFVLE